MKNHLPEYCAVIRTLGKAGDKYQRLLNSLVSQTHRPKKILVYLADGYPRPKESVGCEQIIYVAKGMVAQRALQYTEVDTEWVLFLDDDMYIAPDGVERILSDTLKSKADVCAVDAFPHSAIPLKGKITMALMLTSIPRLFGKNKGYTVNCMGKDVYNLKPKVAYAWSTTNSGNAFLCRKQDFLKIHFEEELWLDETPYAIPDDKVMFYKMHLYGLRIITHYRSGFLHLDAGTSLTGDRRGKIAYSSARNNLIFYKLYVQPNLSSIGKLLSKLGLYYIFAASYIYAFFKEGPNSELMDNRKRGIEDALKFLNRIDG